MHIINVERHEKFFEQCANQILVKRLVHTTNKEANQALFGSFGSVSLIGTQDL